MHMGIRQESIIFVSFSLGGIHTEEKIVLLSSMINKCARYGDQNPINSSEYFSLVEDAQSVRGRPASQGFAPSPRDFLHGLDQGGCLEGTDAYIYLDEGAIRSL